MTTDTVRGQIRCCRYEGHPGDHEEWLDAEGCPVTPISAHLTATWVRDREHIDKWIDGATPAEQGER